jgi:hypothetical protein
MYLIDRASNRDKSSLLTKFDGFEPRVRDWFRRLESERPAA